MKSLKDLIGILAGNLILAFGVTCFIAPMGFITGGATGIGLALNRFWGVNLSYALWAVNGAMFLVGWYFMGRKFALSIIISTLVYPLWINILGRFPVLTTLTDDTLLCAVLGGMLVGIGIGTVIRQGASTGGMDIPPLVINKKFGIPVGVSMYVTDFCILLLQAFFSDSEQILYGLLNLMVISATINYVLVAGQKKVQIFVVSEKFEEIRRQLLTDMDLGVTLVHIETGYLGEQKKAVLCVTSARKVHITNQTILAIDPSAFITVTNISEVKGQGFSLERKYVDDKKTT